MGKLLKGFSTILFLLITQLLCLLPTVYSQIKIETSNNFDRSPERLVKDVFLGNGVKVNSVRRIGSPLSIGKFSGAKADIDIDAGIVLSTGSVTNIDRPNDNPSTGDTPEGTEPTDPDLQALTTYSIKEVTGLEIEFVSQTSELEFKYVFASEEYPEFNCSKFNDIFAFFISGPNPDGGDYDKLNIALVPDPNDPTGNTFTDYPVWTNSVNNGMQGTDLSITDNCDKDSESLDFSQYYNDNEGSLTFTLDGYLDVFKAKASVVPCQVYTIKLIIGDNNDFDFDSAVFLEANSLESRNYEYYINTNFDGTLTESCNTGAIGIKFDNPVTDRVEIPVAVLSDQISDARMGDDVIFSASTFVLNPGDSIAEISIEVLEDDNAEGVEYLRIVEDVNGCSIDTFVVPIYDNPLETYFGALEGNLICVNEPLVDSSFPSDEEPILNFNSTFAPTEFGIGTTDPLEFTLSVNSGNLSNWNRSIINSLCVDGFTHQEAEEVSIILVAPSGLSVRVIDFGDLSGSYFGEQICIDQIGFNALLSNIDLSEEDINGQWRLLLIDGVINSVSGSIDRWSLSFNNPNFLSYTINDDNGNAVDPTAPVVQDMRIYIDALNANGCSFRDTIDIAVIQNIAAPTDLSCREVDRDELEFSWMHVESEVSFEINHGNGWIEVGNVFSYPVTDLGPSQTVFFQVRALARGCSSAEAELTCGTSPCISPEVVVSSRANSDNACDPNGFIEIRSANTKGPYSYWINDVPNPTFRFDDLGEGTYLIRLEDGYGCSNEQQVTISGVAEMKADINKFDAFCGQQGFVDMFVSGGSPPYRYLWSTGSTERNINGLDAGTYIVEISDGSGCMISDSVEIVSSPSITVSDIIPSDVSCANGADGSVNYNISGGTGPFDIIIKNSAGKEYTSNVDLPAESYIIEVTDQTGCVNIKSFEIVEPMALELTFEAQPSSCSFAFDGSAEVAVEGGLAPYEYLWTDGNTSPINTGLSSGFASIRVTDANGCETTDSVEVLASEEPLLLITETPVGCYSGDDGSIQIDVTNMDFRVIWDDGITVPLRENLIAGTYCVDILTEFGCRIDTCIQIIEPANIRTTIRKTNNVCFGVNDGTIQLNISQGQAPYLISYNGLTASTEAILELTNLSVGSYNFTIQDANGCTSSATSVIEATSAVTIDLMAVDVSCAFGNNGSIETTIEGIVEQPIFDWTGPDNYSSNSRSLSDLQSGVYSLLISDAKGCSYTQAVTIEEPAEAISASYMTEDVSCYGETDGFISINASGGVGALSYSLSNDGSFSTDNQFFGLDSGVYTVYIRDESECSYELSDILIEEPSEFIVSLDFDTLVYEYQDVKLKVDVVDPQGGYDLFWSSDPADLLPCASCDSVTIVEIERSIVLAVEAIDDAGCSAYTEQKVFVRRGNHVAVPTAFTPNADLNNDLLYIYGTSGAVVKEFSVFDRTGVKLFSDQNITVNQEDRGWDGRYKGTDMITGSYVWTALAEFPGGDVLKFSGSVQLIR